MIALRYIHQYLMSFLSYGDSTFSKKEIEKRGGTIYKMEGPLRNCAFDRVTRFLMFLQTKGVKSGKNVDIGD